MKLLEVEDLSVGFRTPRGVVQALTNASIALDPGELLLVVGESGSGKTVLAHSLLRLLPRNASVSGVVRLGGEDLLGLSEKRMRDVRGRRIALIPQSPGASLNPVRRLGPQLLEATRVRGLSKKDATRQLGESLGELGLNFEETAGRYVHQLSGGMQQRVVNALALVGEPEIVIADEPTSGLDADLIDTTAAQLLKVLEEGAALLVITHDLRLAERLGGWLALLYASRIVETRPTPAFFAGPAHPYGYELLRALPEREMLPIPGRPPELNDLPPYCPFTNRCPWLFEPCTDHVPEPFPLPDGGRTRCFLHADR